MLASFSIKSPNLQRINSPTRTAAILRIPLHRKPLSGLPRLDEIETFEGDTFTVWILGRTPKPLAIA